MKLPRGCKPRLAETFQVRLRDLKSRLNHPVQVARKETHRELIQPSDCFVLLRDQRLHSPLHAKTRRGDDRLDQ